MTNPTGSGNNIPVKPDVQIRYATGPMLIALIPAILLSSVFFGAGSLSMVIAVTISSLLWKFLIERLIYRHDCSFFDVNALLTGLLLAVCLPSSLALPYILAGSLLAITLTCLPNKWTFNISLHPAMFSFAFLLLLFPSQFSEWPALITSSDTISGATPLSLFKEIVSASNGQLQLSQDQNPTLFNLFWGNRRGSFGEISSISLLIGGGYLLWRKVISWHLPATIFLTSFLLACLTWLFTSGGSMDPVSCLLSGGLVAGAIFMVADPVNIPTSTTGKVVAGILIGFITYLFRNFSGFPEGIAFAILFANILTPYLNAKDKILKDYIEKLHHLIGGYKRLNVH